MKTMKFLCSMLMVMALPLFVSCSSDDDGASNYTSEEIIELLNGKWAVAGEIIEQTSDYFAGQYKGTIEFKENNKFSFNITDGDQKAIDYPELYGGRDSYYPENDYMRWSGTYSILKKGGKNYLTLGYSKYPFELVSITKNNLKLVLDEDIISDNSKGHVYMTIVSN